MLCLRLYRVLPLRHASVGTPLAGGVLLLEVVGRGGEEEGEEEGVCKKGVCVVVVFLRHR